MAYLRAILFYLGMWVVTLPFGLLVPFLLPFPPHARYAVIRYWGRLVLPWFRLTCGVDYRVEGAENIPEGPAVVLAKHQSTWETIALQSIFPTQTWVLKRELLRIPLFGWGLWAAWPVAIDRAAGKEALRQVIEQGQERLKAGFWMIVFPEGTRVAPGTKGRYAIGGAMLAKQAGVPVVPVAHNAGEHWPKGGLLKHPGTITIAIGPAIPTSNRKASEITEAAEAWIEGKMAEIGTKKVLQEQAE